MNKFGEKNMDPLLKKIFIGFFIVISIFGVIINIHLFTLLSTPQEFTVKISQVHETQGWNYTLTITPVNFTSVYSMSINLSLIDENAQFIISSFELEKDVQSQNFHVALGLLTNGEYSIDLKIEYINGEHRLYENIKSISVGAND